MAKRREQTEELPAEQTADGNVATAEVPPPAEAIQNGKHKESKEERFARLAPKRVNRAVKYIGHVGNLANRSSYHYTKAQREAVCAAIIQATDALVRRFERIPDGATGFVLPTE